MRDLDIAEVAQRSGVAASTLRFYEEKRLIASIGRRGLRRVFDPDVLVRLALIALGRSAGFSLDEIALMFAPDGRLRIDREMLAAKAEELDKTIRKLTKMRDSLRHAAVCRAPSHMECPKFRRILQAAASGAVKQRVRARLQYASHWLPDRDKLSGAEIEGCDGANSLRVSAARRLGRWRRGRN
jgi:DNA-binding transcriptional MerR regulator